MDAMEHIEQVTGPVSALVYPTIRFEELGRLLHKFGFDAERIDDGGGPAWRTLGSPRFTALLPNTRGSRPSASEFVFLYAHLFSTHDISPTVVRDLRWKTIYAHLIVHNSGHIAATHDLMLAGGVTERYLREQLRTWRRDLEIVRNAIRNQLRRAAGSSLH